MNPITITPHLGIGDLIIVKMIQLTNNMNISHININNPLIRVYSSDYNTKITFVNHLIRWLFPYATVSINDIEPDFFNFIVTYTYQRVPLYNHVNIPNKLTDEYSNALVFHTKFRYDRLIDQCQQTIIPKLISSLRYDFIINPTNQDLSILLEFFEFIDIISFNHFLCLLLG
jgi:hypothetical protein